MKDLTPCPERRSRSGTGPDAAKEAAVTSAVARTLAPAGTGAGKRTRPQSTPLPLTLRPPVRAAAALRLELLRLGALREFEWIDRERAPVADVQSESHPATISLHRPVRLVLGLLQAFDR